MGSGQLILRLSPDCEDQDVSYRVGDPVGLKDQDALGQEEETHRKQEVGKTGRGKGGGKTQEAWDINRKWTESRKQEGGSRKQTKGKEERHRKLQVGNKPETGSRNDARNGEQEEGKTKTGSCEHTRKPSRKKQENPANGRKQEQVGSRKQETCRNQATEWWNWRKWTGNRLEIGIDIKKKRTN